MMHSMGSAGWMVFAGVAWLLLIGLAGWLAVRLVRPPRRPPVTVPSALDILERRFATGKISRGDFDEARARLREHELDI